MRRLTQRPGRTVLLAAALILVLDLIGIHMFKTPLYVPEAKRPAAFPSPGKIGRV